MAGIFRRSPSKFGGGISLLWRGMSPALLRDLRVEAERLVQAGPLPDMPGRFLFESARSALFNCLTALGIGAGDEVVISAFTCSAVTYGVARTGATVVYADINDDLTMNDAAVLAAVGPKTKAVVVQNTFGRLGLRPETIEKLKASGLIVIEDCALSVGSSFDRRSHGSFGDVSTWSLEVSKTLTLGWGGVLTVNNPALLEPIARRYGALRPISAWRDYQRLAQLRISARLARRPVPAGVYLWLFLYGTGIFRGSSDSERNDPSDLAQLGSSTRALFHALEPRAEALFSKTNANYRSLLETAKSLGLLCPVVQSAGEFIVTPRFPVIVDASELSNIEAEASARKIELGRWFDEAPPSSGLERARVSSCSNAKRISEVIVNVPCHWSLSGAELRSIQALMACMAPGIGMNRR